MHEKRRTYSGMRPRGQPVLSGPARGDLGGRRVVERRIYSDIDVSDGRAAIATTASGKSRESAGSRRLC